MGGLAHHQAVGSVVTKYALDKSGSVATQAGIDYNLSANKFANFDVRQTFLSTRARISGATLTIGAGMGYRF